MSKGEMTSYERVMTALALGRPDRVPVVPSATAFSMKNAGFKYSECLFDAEKHTLAQVKLRRDYDLDGVWGPSSNSVPEGIGAPIRILDDNPPVIEEPTLKRYEDFDKLEPMDVTKNGRVPLLIDIARELRKAFKGEVPVFAVCPTPYTFAVALRGAQALYKDMVRNPEFVERVLDYSVRPTVDYAAALAEAGGDVLWFPDPMCGTTCLSRKHYERFVFPYTKRAFDKLRSQGIKIVYHVCGDWHDRLDLASQGVDCWHLAIEADLPAVKKEYGDRLCLMGNIRSVDVLYGTPEDTEKESIRCLEQGAAGGGFILSSDCGLPRDSAPANVRAMAEAAKKYGIYR